MTLDKNIVLGIPLFNVPAALEYSISHVKSQCVEFIQCCRLAIEF